MGGIAQKNPKAASNWVTKQKKKEGYLQGKVENNKYPVVKTCGSRN